MPILIIDDDDLIVEAAPQYLMRCGYDVQTAREFGMAMSLMLTCDFNAVLMDLHLTGGSAGEGLKMVQWIRDQFPSMHIGVTTASTADSVREAARALGVMVFVNKPADLKSLLEAVHTLSATRENSHVATETI